MRCTFCEGTPEKRGLLVDCPHCEDGYGWTEAELAAEARGRWIGLVLCWLPVLALLLDRLRH